MVLDLRIVAELDGEPVARTGWMCAGVPQGFGWHEQLQLWLKVQLLPPYWEGHSGADWDRVLRC